MDDNIIQKIKECVARLDGKTAIYRERGRIYQVMVSRVCVASDNFMATASPIETQGIPSKESWRIASIEPWEFGAAWKYLRLRSGCLSATGYVNWDLFLDPQVIAGVLRILATVPPGKTYLDDIRGEQSAAQNNEATPGRQSKSVYLQIKSYLEKSIHGTTM